MPTHGVLTLSACELVRRMHAGELSPVEVVDHHIARIEAVNPTLNAMVTPLFVQARQRARELAALAPGQRRDLALLGLPVSIKDAIAVAGVRFTAGAKARAQVVAETDAEVVRRLRDAGAVILGKSNCSDLSVAPETDSAMFGLTRNPWHPEHSPGGSSGGEAALVASGASALGIGADIGGSVRLPAAMCGVVGFKPAAHGIATAGHVPEAPAAIAGWNTIGPLVRRVEDLALVLPVLTGTALPSLSPEALSGRPLLRPPPVPLFGVSAEIGAALNDAEARLREVGMASTAATTLPLVTAAWHAGAGLSKHLPPLFEQLGTHPELGRPARNVLRAMGIGRAVARLLDMPNIDRLAAMANQVTAALADGLLLWPVFPGTAPHHGYTRGLHGLPVYTCVFNALGLPAVSVPMGLSEHGLPLAVQLVAAPGNEASLVAGAALLEARHGGWRVADGLVSSTPTDAEPQTTPGRRRATR